MNGNIDKKAQRARGTPPLANKHKREFESVAGGVGEDVGRGGEYCGGVG